MAAAAAEDIDGNPSGGPGQPRVSEDGPPAPGGKAMRTGPPAAAARSHGSVCKYTWRPSKVAAGVQGAGPAHLVRWVGRGDLDDAATAACPPQLRHSPVTSVVLLPACGDRSATSLAHQAGRRSNRCTSIFLTLTSSPFRLAAGHSSTSRLSSGRLLMASFMACHLTRESRPNR